MSNIKKEKLPAKKRKFKVEETLFPVFKIEEDVNYVPLSAYYEALVEKNVAPKRALRIITCIRKHAEEEFNKRNNISQMKKRFINMQSIINNIDKRNKDEDIYRDEVSNKINRRVKPFNNKYDIAIEMGVLDLEKLPNNLKRYSHELNLLF